MDSMNLFEAQEHLTKTLEILHTQGASGQENAPTIVLLLDGLNEVEM